MDWTSGQPIMRPATPDDQLATAAPVPAVISRFQARAALMDAGLLADVELAIGSAGPLVQLAWSEATEWRRDSPTISAIANAMQLDKQQVDDLFISAAMITA